MLCFCLYCIVRCGAEGARVKEIEYLKIRPKYSQCRSFSENKPVTCSNSFRGKRLSLLARCITNLSECYTPL